MMDRVAKGNAAWVFGLEPGEIRAYLQPFHLTLIADVGRADYLEKYLRPLKRELVVSEIERIVKVAVTPT
jgi:hypothetical protein